MKGGLAASVIAACAIKAAGIDLKGEIVVTAVSGETERTPVEGAIRSYRGDLYTGSAIGTQWLVDHGITGDFVINEEPSDCRICWENCGYCWFKVQAKGRMAYVARKEDGLNAILVMTKIIEEIEKWTPIYSAAHKSELTVPQVMVCAIEAGWPYKIGMCPAICNLYVDVRTAPGQLPQDAVREFSNFLEELQTCDPELNLTCDPYIVKAGERTDPDSYFVRSCIKAHESVIGKKHKNCLPGQAGAWTDCNVFRKAGIPAVSLGPGTGAPVTQGRQKSPQMWIGGESVSINQLMAAAKIYVMAALDICLRDRQELGLG
jgi:acetylornithine deacetylase/succinyl-diaminopimelate desuccinylase-like protein